MFSKSVKGTFVFCLLLSLTITYAFSLNIEDKKNNIVFIKGKGKPPAGSEYSQSQKRIMARRAAIVDAYRNALIYYEKYDKNKWKIKKYAKIRIKGKIKGAKIVKTAYKSDDWVEVTVKIPKKRIKR